MKVLLFISSLFLIVSCGKYEKPFITFKSPEKRLTDGTWGCTKVVSEEGSELQIEDRITFRIDGTDSIFTRVTNHWPLNPLYYTVAPSPSISDTIVGTWTWANAIGENVFNKQIIQISYPSTLFGRNNRVSILSNKELVFQDQSFDNSTYHYKKL